MQQFVPTHGVPRRQAGLHTQGLIAMSGFDAQVAAQAPAQQLSVAAQVAVPHLQSPPTQVEPSPQRLPHAPQLLMSESRLLHPAVPQQL